MIGDNVKDEKTSKKSNIYFEYPKKTCFQVKSIIKQFKLI